MAITQSPLKLGLSKAKDMYVQGAKDFGNRVGSIANTISETARNIREIRDPDLAKKSIQASQGGQATGGGADNTNNAGNTGVQSNSSPQIGGKLASDLSSIKPVNSSIVDTQVAKGEFARGSSGATYVQGTDGGIFKRDTSGSVSKLGDNISSMGPNGSTVSRDLTAKEKDAMARSSQMISDWQDYKRQKEAQGLRNFIQANLGNQYITSSQRQEATDRLNAIEKGDIDKQQLASQENIQARQLGTTARKNAFDEQKETAKLGIDSFKAQSEERGRLASQQTDTFKLIGEVDKNIGSTQDKAAIYKSRGMWNPLTIKSVYSKEKLGDFKTPDDLRQKLVNDDSVDQGDIEDIVFSYFPSNQ